MQEGHRQKSLRAQPAVADGANEVVRRQRLEDRNKELEHVVILAEGSLQEEILVVQDVLAIHVDHEDPESLLE